MTRTTLSHPIYFLVLATLVLCEFFIAASCAADWPQFRGPNCTGISASSNPLPIDFSESKNMGWSAELGDGVGCPIVVGGKVFVSAMTDDDQLGLYAFDAISGKRLWTRRWSTPDLPDVHKTNSHASTTPAADHQRVYLYSSHLGMIAVRASDGKDVWHKPLPTPFFVFKWGPAMSPVLHHDRLIFCQDDDLYPAIYAIDKHTGEIQWKDERYDMAVNYSHPVVCKTPTGDEIVVAGTGKLIGYDPNSGKRLWYSKSLLRNIKTTPVVQQDVIYISLQSSGIANQWLATADQSETGNNDGKLTKEEMQSFLGKVQIPTTFFQRTFDRGDKNKDGFLEGAELDHAFLHPDNFAGARFDIEDPADEYIIAVKAGGRGDVTQTHQLWKHRTKYTDHIVSPLVYDGRMFLLKGGGISTVFNISDGQSLRGAKRLPNTGNYFASPVLGDDKIFLAGENGTILVIKNAPNYPVLAKNVLQDSIVATPAISDDGLFVRTRSKLLCFR